MNRREFFFSSLTVGLASALPLSVAAAALEPTRRQGPSPCPSAWQSLEECQSRCGRHFRASGPVEADLKLLKAERFGSGKGRQFVASFEAPSHAPEGLYRLDSDGERIDLFLQPVHGEPGTLQAVFNLID